VKFLNKTQFGFCTIKKDYFFYKTRKQKIALQVNVSFLKLFDAMQGRTEKPISQVKNASGISALSAQK